MSEPLRISVVIPVFNAAVELRRCLDALASSGLRADEIIVVDDGSTDNSAATARQAGARVQSTGGRRGPAFARNLGAEAATGNILLFLDADVCAHPDAIPRVHEAFARERDLDAVIGAYDDAPAEQSFVSLYKNLQHCYVHRRGRREASTFWSGCGAIRRDLFLESGGFDAGRYTRPSIEDIELGSRLKRQGRKLMLDPGIQVKHLKRWTLLGLLKTDIFDRALPWTDLILRDGAMPNDLNVQTAQRVSVALVCGAPAAAVVWLPAGIAALAAAATLNADFYRFLAARRGTAFALRSVPLHLLYFLYSGVAFAAGLAKWIAQGRPRTRIV